MKVKYLKSDPFSFFDLKTGSVQLKQYTFFTSLIDLMENQWQNYTGILGLANRAGNGEIP